MLLLWYVHYIDTERASERARDASYRGSHRHAIRAPSSHAFAFESDDDDDEEEVEVEDSIDDGATSYETGCFSRMVSSIRDW